MSVRGQATAVATLINFGSNFGVRPRSPYLYLCLSSQFIVTNVQQDQIAFTTLLL